VRFSALVPAGLRLRRRRFGFGADSTPSPPAFFAAVSAAGCACASPLFFFRLRRRDLRDGAFGAGRLSASAPAIS
jgi:hypothetical protein